MYLAMFVPSSGPVFQTRLGGVPALHVFTQYDADFRLENLSNSLNPIHIYLPQGSNFLKELVKIDSHGESLHSVSLVIDLPIPAADLLRFLE